MLILNISEKERIGKLFKYYRKKNKIQWKEIEKICSTSTYSRIEKGIPLKNNDTYERLFDLYKISYIYKENFEEWLNDYLIRFDEILTYYKEDCFDELINELNIILKNDSQMIIYQQYYNVFLYALNYYKHSKYMTFEEIEESLELLDCFDFNEILMIYLLEVMFLSNLNVHYNYEIQDKIISYIKDINTPILKYYLGFYYKTLSMFDTALELFEQSIVYWNQQNNDFRYVQSLIGKFVIYKNIDNKKSNEMIELFEQLKQDNKINETLLPRLNYNIAMFYYMNGEYEKAYDYFYEDVIKYEAIDEMIFICAICTQMRQPIPEIINKINIIDHPHNTYLIYFRLKHLGESKKTLADYIFQDIIPNKLVNQIYVQPFWKIYEEELLGFCEEDKRYAIKLLEYIEKKKKVCKNA